MTVSTSQAFKLCGMPSGSVWWSLVRRHPELRRYVIREQRHRAWLWDERVIEEATRIYNAQQSRHPWRTRRATLRTQIQNLPLLSAAQVAAIQKKLADLEAAWLAARDDAEREKLKAGIKLQQRILRADLKKKQKAP